MDLLFGDGTPISRDAVFQSDDDSEDSEVGDHSSDGLSSNVSASGEMAGHDEVSSSGGGGGDGGTRHRRSQWGLDTGTGKALYEAFAKLPSFEEIYVDPGAASEKASGGEVGKTRSGINQIAMEGLENEEEKEVEIDDGSGSAKHDDNDGDGGDGTAEQGLEFEFRLFADTTTAALKSPSGPVCANTSDMAAHTASGQPASSIITQRVRLDSPLANRNPGFVVSTRPREYYMASAPSAAKRAEFESVAVGGEDIRKSAGRAWPGCGYEWRVIRVRSSNGGGGFGKGRGKDGGNDAAFTGGITFNQVKGSEAIDAGIVMGPDGAGAGIGTGMGEALRKKERSKSKKSKPGKRARIKLRMLMRAEAQKKVAERDKKTRKNQMRKVKRKEKEKREKNMIMMMNKDVVE